MIKHVTTRQHELIQACAVIVQGDRHRVFELLLSYYPCSIMSQAAMWCLVGKRTADLQNEANFKWNYFLIKKNEYKFGYF